MTRAIQWVAWGALLLWALIVNYYPVANFDIWVHMAVGRDIFATGDFPHVDTFSWTARGRPFTAHEWLAGLFFFLVGTATDGVGLTIVRAWLVSLVALAVWIALPRDVRRAWPTWLLVAVTLAQVTLRAYVRPHLFSLFFAALLLAGFAWWRHHRRWRALAWTVPLTALWANLHGAYLLCPVLLAGVGSAALVAARFPALSPGDADRPWTTKQALQPLVLAALCLAAATATPYGFSLFGFSTEMAASNEYIKKMIVEWLPTFSGDLRMPQPYLFLVGIATVGIGIALAPRTLSLPELLPAAVTCVMGFTAIRYLPYFALFSLPVASKAFADFVDRHRRGERVLSSLAAAVPVALLLLTAFVWGPSLRMRVTLPFSAGFAGHSARDAAHRLHELNYQGGVFCEYEDGAYLVYAGRGQFFPVIDGRIDIYGERLVLLWYGARTQPPERTNLYLDHFRVNAAILYPDHDQYDELRQALLATGAWREEVHETFTLLLRTPPLPT